MNQWVIYKHTSLDSGKSYVGMTKFSIAKRWKEHKWEAARGSDLHFHRAIQLYGVRNWSHDVVADGITSIEEASALERYYIKKFNTFENGYNLTIGGTSAPTNPVEKTYGTVALIHEFLPTLVGTVTELSISIGCTPANIVNVLTAKALHIYGYTLPTTDPVGFTTISNVPLIFKHTSGCVFEGTGKELKKKYKLGNIRNLHSIVKIPTRSIFGWYVVTHPKQKLIKYKSRKKES